MLPVQSVIAWGRGQQTLGATTRPKRTRRQFQIVAAQSIQATRPVL